MHLRKWIFITFLVLVAAYFFYEARDVLFSPRLEIFEPQNGASLNTTRVRIAGRTNPRLKVWIYGRGIQSDENGFFEDYFSMHPGYYELGVFVKDKFDNETRKVLKIVVK